jgi:hypothetical protein
LIMKSLSLPHYGELASQASDKSLHFCWFSFKLARHD